MTKSSVNSTLQIVTNIVILLIAVVILLFAADRFGLYSIGGQTVITTTAYLPPEEPSCTDYNIPQEYRYAYGNPAIDALEAGCLGAGGVYVEQYSELSCHWNPDAFLIDCSEDPQIEFRRFCLDELKGTYVCDPSIAYFGCHCNRPIPAEWTPSEYDDGQDQPPEGEDPDANGDGVDETLCAMVELPAYGDLGTLCRDNGACILEQDDYVCSHYWDYLSKTHRCSCAENYWCPQYCFSYSFSSGCSCPPNSYRVQIDRTNHQCIPLGCTCDGTDIIC